MNLGLGMERERSRGQTLVEFALVAPLLFLLLIAIFEAGRYVLFVETLNNASREGARFAIVNGDNAACPTGPLPPPATYADYGNCAADPDGTKVKQAVADSAQGLAAMGDLFVDAPVWTTHGDFAPPAPGATSSGYNTRGDFVTVFVEYSYDPLFRSIFGVGVVPPITISSESSLVINY